MSSALDLLVLAAIEEGINTVYRLRENAGLSPGTTSPTIRRLVEEGMIRKAALANAASRSWCLLPLAGRSSPHSLIHYWFLLSNIHPRISNRSFGWRR